MRHFSVVVRLLAGASLLGMGSAAWAQSGTSDADTAPASTADIVVTGSRVITNGDNSPSPVTVVAQESLQNIRPTSITDGLSTLPVFSGSRGQMSNPSATGGVGGGNGVAAQLNLRNIGANRNLILLDGRRVPPTSISNIVDADMIPQQFIQRVDMVTGGVSAVYGSDAVSGVINFITDRKFKGVKAHAQYGIADEGDAGAFNAGVAFGTDLFGGRGHFQASYEFRDDKGVLARSDRSWFNQAAVVGSGTTASPYQLLENVRLANFPFGGRITCGTACGLNGQYFANDGVLSPFVNGTATSTANVQVGGAGGYLDHSLKAPLRSHQIYSRFDYDVSDDIHAFIVGATNIKRNAFLADYLQLTNVQISSANPYLSPAYQSQLAAAGSSFRFSRMVDQDSQNGAVAKSQQYMVNAGLEGSFGDYRWNLAYTHGYSRLHTTLTNNINEGRLAAAMDATVNPATGQIVCNASLTNSAYANCVPLNLFGPSASSAAALDYVLGDTGYLARTYMDDVVADISGSPFSTWAGPVTVALSGEWRKQRFRSNSAATPSQLADCSGIRYNCTQGRTQQWRLTFPETDTIKQSVWEGAIEAEVPLLKDVPLVQSLSVNGALRYTSYDTVGDYWTWKVGAAWAINDDLRVRGTLSRDIRAPTLNDLYAPQSVVLVNNTDLLTGTQPAIPSINFGNANLTAEIGSTKTLGVVWKPGFAPGFSIAVDYYDIKVSDAITTVQGFNPTFQAACYASGGTSPYCDLQERPNGFADTSASNAATAWLVTVINIAEIQTRGVDVELNYNGELFGRPLNLRGLAAYQPHIYYKQPSLATVDQGGVAFGTTGLTASPAWRLTGTVSYKLTDSLRVDVMHRWRNAMKLWATGQWVNNRVGAFGQTALNISFQIPDTRLDSAEFFLNVQNLFDNDPAPANAANSSNAPGGFNGFAVTDDAIGRYITAGVRVKF